MAAKASGRSWQNLHHAVMVLGPPQPHDGLRVGRPSPAGPKQNQDDRAQPDHREAAGFGDVATRAKVVAMRHPARNEPRSDPATLLSPPARQR